MNKTELETQIGYRIRTADRDFISNDEITVELNRSIDRLSGKIDIADTLQTTTIAFTSDGSYALDSTFKKPISLYDRTNNRSYKRVTKSELYDTEDYGENVYTIDGSNILIESSTENTTLTLTYYSTNDCKDSGGTLQKGLISSTDEPLLQPRFHDYFVEDVSMVLFRKERKYDDYNVAKVERNEIFKAIEDENKTLEEDVVEIVGSYSETYS